MRNPVITDALAVAKASPVMPVITVQSVQQAIDLGAALLAGGVPVMEITLRSDAGLDAITALTARKSKLIVGAGTVTNPVELEQAVAAGAQFVVTPGASAELLAAAAHMRVALIPGVQTSSDVMAARAAGYRFVKFFPAGPAGGTAMLKAFAGPYGDVVFCPTGGVGPDNMADYLRLPNVVCVGGSWLTPASLLAAEDWSAISALAKQARDSAAAAKQT